MMNKQESVIKRLHVSINESFTTEEAIEKFLAPRKGRQISNDVLISELLEFCHEKINSPNKSDWTETVSTAVKIVKELKKRGQNQINSKATFQTQVPPQFNQKKEEKRINCKKNADGSFVIYFDNGSSKTFSEKQMKFFCNLAKEYTL